MSSQKAKLIAVDLATYTAVDSLKARKLELNYLTENTIAITLHQLLVKSIIHGKLSGILDSMSAPIVEDYVSRFGSQIVTEYAMGKERSPGNIAKETAFYEVGVLLVGSANLPSLLNNSNQVNPAPLQTSLF